MPLAARLGAVQLHQHAVIDLRAERFLYRAQISLVPVRCQLDPVRQAPAKIVHEHEGVFGIAPANRVGDEQLRSAVTSMPPASNFCMTGLTSSAVRTRSTMTMPSRGIFSKASQPPRAKPGLISIPSRVTLRSVRGKATR